MCKLHTWTMFRLTLWQSASHCQTSRWKLSRDWLQKKYSFHMNLVNNLHLGASLRNDLKFSTASGSYCLGNTTLTSIQISDQQEDTDFFWYCMDHVTFCNISVIQQDTQYLMINFIHNIQQLNNILLLWGWRKNCSSSFTLITYPDIQNCNIQHKNAPEDGLMKPETCWATECCE